MPKVVLVCEGPDTGLDKRLLNILIRRHDLPVELVEVAHAGGERSLPVVAEYLRTRGGPKVVVFTIADRNHRSAAEAAASWSSRNLLWTRHEIENYLLDPEFVAAAFLDIRRDAPWAAGLPTEVPLVAALLRDLVGPLLVPHAGRLLHEQLMQELGPRHQRELAVPKLAVDAEPRAWVDALHGEQQRLQAACQSVCACDREILARRMEGLLGQVQGDEFLKGGFLHDVGGHELLAALLQYLHGLGGRRVSLADLEDRLQAAFALRYDPQADPAHDFVRLMNLLAAACRPAQRQ